MRQWWWRALMMTIHSVVVVAIPVVLPAAGSSSSSTTPAPSVSKTSADPPVFDDAIPGTSCAQPAVLMAAINTQSPASPSVHVLNAVQFKLALQQSACFKLQLNESEGAEEYSELLYTISYVKLEHIYNIWHRYDFGIPSISTSCTCDCTGGDQHCTPAHVNQVPHDQANCSQPASCVHTFHPHMQATGCLAGTEANACCSLRITPYNNWRFTAFSLSRPRYQATFEYKLYSRRRASWSLLSERTVQTALNQLQSSEFDRGRISVKVSGAEPIERLQSAAYFTFANETRLRVGVPLNQIHEHSMHKLGWYRHVDGGWHIKQAHARLQDSLKVKMSNCYEHEFEQSLVGEHYVLTSAQSTSDSKIESFHLGSYLDQRETWIGGMHLRAHQAQQRQLAIGHRGSHHVELDLALSQLPLPTLVTHQARFEDFTGRIQLDKFSNRFLNITFLNGSGTLIGSSYELSSERARLDLAFSVYIADQTGVHNEIIDLPPSVNGDRRICFYPAGATEQQKCKLLEYEAVPLHSFRVPYGWVVGAGDCVGCNHIGVDNFVKYLDPTEWLDGIAGTSEAIALAFEIVVYVLLCLLMLVIVRKCIWPLCSCLFCSSSSSKTSCSGGSSKCSKRSCVTDL